MMATDYFTEWIEAVPTRRATDEVIVNFLEENILSRFGCPRRILTDNVAAFKSNNMVKFYQKYHISLNHSTSYYPQGNGLEDSSNKILVRIIKKMVGRQQKGLTHEVKVCFVG